MKQHLQSVTSSTVLRQVEGVQEEFLEFEGIYELTLWLLKQM